MSVSRRPWAHWLWLAGVAALVAHGLITTARAIPRAGPGLFTGRMASTDHMLGFLYTPHPANAITSALAGTPESAAVLFVGPARHPALAQTFYGVQNAALPRIVADLRCDAAGPTRVPLALSVPYGAVVIYEPARPVEDPHAIRVGEHLVVLPGPARPDLVSYCSSVVPATP